MKERLIKDRISVEVPKDVLIELKKRALMRNMTMKRYVLALVIEQFAREDKLNYKQG